MNRPMHETGAAGQYLPRLALMWPSGKRFAVPRMLPVLLALTASAASGQALPVPPASPSTLPADIPGPEAPLPDLPGGDAVAWPDVESTTGGEVAAPDAAIK